MAHNSNKSSESNNLLPLDGLRYNDNTNSVLTETELGSVKKANKPEKSLVVEDMIEERSEKDREESQNNMKKVDLKTAEVKKSATLKKTLDGADKTTTTKKKFGSNKDLESVTKAVPSKTGTIKQTFGTTTTEQKSRSINKSLDSRNSKKSGSEQTGKPIGSI